MKAAIQQQINPVVPQSARSMQPTGKKDPTKVVEAGGASEVDFLSVMNNSNREIKEERTAKENGDLSSAKDYDEFIQKLNKRNQPNRTPKNSMDKDDFLKLFVTQLKHQDPLNPEDSTEMASRLAHFNSLEQMLNVNKTLTKMLDGQKENRSIDLINYIGKEIELGNGRIKLEKDETASTEFKLKRDATKATLKVRDGSGEVVFEKDLGMLKQGDHKLNWDGKKGDGSKANAGTYSFSVTALGINDEEIPVEISSKAKITGVDIQDGNGALFTDLGRVELKDIKAIGEQGYRDNLQTSDKKVDAIKADSKQAMNASAGLSEEQLKQQALKQALNQRLAAMMAQQENAQTKTAETNQANVDGKKIIQKQTMPSSLPQQPASRIVPGASGS